jgi:hypothetical protein
MSRPDPRVRTRDRIDKGEQPYKDAREAMAQTEAEIQEEAEAFGEERSELTEEERRARLEADLSETLDETNEELVAERARRNRSKK